MNLEEKDETEAKRLTVRKSTHARIFKLFIGTGSQKRQTQLSKVISEGGLDNG